MLARARPLPATLRPVFPRCLSSPAANVAAVPGLQTLPVGGAGPVRWPATNEDDGARLDRFIKRRAPGLPPGLIQRLIRQRRIKVAGVTANRNAFPVQAGDVVEFPGDVKLGLSRGKKKPKADDVSLKEAEFIRSRILHKDARCVVLDKPAGLPTQGGTGVGERHVDALLPGLGEGRHYLVHRLDREVSGALVVARDVAAAAELADHFRKRRVEKLYWAFVSGKVPASGGVIRLDIDGKSAETAYRVVQNMDGHGAWLALLPCTGRKHQLRIHCALGLECPIVGEAKYFTEEMDDPFGHMTLLRATDTPGIANLADAGAGLHLHARTLAFPKLTKTDRGKRQSEVRVVAPLSPHMRSSFNRLGLNESHGNEVTF
jgi:23S rRNA pseudouridine955/2504/2580 synthase